MTERFYAWEDAVEVAKHDDQFKWTESSVRFSPNDADGEDGESSQRTSADDLQWDDDVWVEEDEGKKPEPRAA